MPTFNDFNENGKLVSTRQEPLNSRNIDRYISDHNVDRVKGYIDALSDFLHELGPVIWTDFNPEKDANRQNSTLRRSMLPAIDLIKDKEKLISYLNKVIEEPPKPNGITP